MTIGWVAPPEPPELPPGTAEELARYAEQIALHIQREMEQTRQDGRDVSEFPGLIQGWEFTALALRETYDIEAGEEAPYSRWNSAVDCLGPQHCPAFYVALEKR